MQWLTDFSVHLEGLFKLGLLGPAPSVSDSRGLGWGRASACLTGFQGMQMLPAQGPSLGSHWLLAGCPSTGHKY